MIKRIKKYLADNKKGLYSKLLVLILVSLIMGMFFVNFLLVRKLIIDLISAEKNSHAQEICAAMNEVSQETDFFTEKIDQMRNKKNYLDKNQKKEIILALRKLEGDIRKIDIAYFGFYNDLSLKFFSWEKDSPVDNLFSQIKNLPIYGYRAVEAMEDCLSSEHITRNQKDVLWIEFDELREKLKSISAGSGICAPALR